MAKYKFFIQKRLKGTLEKFVTTGNTGRKNILLSLYKLTPSDEQYDSYKTYIDTKLYEKEIWNKTSPGASVPVRGSSSGRGGRGGRGR
jgi:hypothetical protein